MSEKIKEKPQTILPFSFNLISEPWIPVVNANGKREEVGILDALTKSHEWVDLDCDSPLATVGVLRLLLAVLYRTCAPRSNKEWEEVWGNGDISAHKNQIKNYLDKQSGFDLFSETQPFLQVANLVSSRLPVSKLAAEMATANNRLLFEWGSVGTTSVCTPSQAARRLLEMQCFCLGGGISSKAYIGDEVYKRPNFEDGAVARGVSTWLTGENFFQTLWLNIVPLSDDDENDVPFWEQDEPFNFLDEKASGGIDRLVWQSRLIRLEPERDEQNQTVVRMMQFTQGRSADKDFSLSRDFMGIYSDRNKEEAIRFLRLSSEKTSWRDLHSYLAFGTLQNPVLSNVGNEILKGTLDAATPYKLNVVGLVADKASIALWRHDRMNIPAVLLTNRDRIGDLSIAINDAEFVARVMRQKMISVIKTFLQPEGDPAPKDVENLLGATDPRRAYWSRLESKFAHFLSVLAGDHEAAITEWRKEVEDQAERALRASCKQLGDSVRAIRAEAQVSYKFCANEAEEKLRIEAAIQKKKDKEKADKAKEGKKPK